MMQRNTHTHTHTHMEKCRWGGDELYLRERYEPERGPKHHHLFWEWLGKTRRVTPPVSTQRSEHPERTLKTGRVHLLPPWTRGLGPAGRGSQVIPGQWGAGPASGPRLTVPRGHVPPQPQHPGDSLMRSPGCFGDNVFEK